MEGDFQSKVQTDLTPTERVILTAGGGLMCLYGLARRGKIGMGMVALGGSMLYRAKTGHSVMSALGGSTARQRMAPPWRRPIRVQRSMTINLPRQEVYAFWRSLENLPRFMRHLVEVRETDTVHSHWVARAPMDRTVEWDARTVTDVEGEQISWESMPGSDIPNKGTVRFQDAPGGRGTELRVSLEYIPPAGTLGATVAKLFGEEPEIQVNEDLQRFKALLETGEVPTIEGQPFGTERDKPLRSTESQAYMG